MNFGNITGKLIESNELFPYRGDFEKVAREKRAMRQEVKVWQQAYLDVARRLSDAEQEIVQLKAKRNAYEVITGNR